MGIEEGKSAAGDIDTIPVSNFMTKTVMTAGID
jgi:hypothetical protein